MIKSMVMWLHTAYSTTSPLIYFTYRLFYFDVNILQCVVPSGGMNNERYIWRNFVKSGRGKVKVLLHNLMFF